MYFAHNNINSLELSSQCETVGRCLTVCSCTVAAVLFFSRAPSANQ